MGNVQANITKQTLEAYTDVMNSAMINAYNQVYNECTASNYMTVEFCPTVVITGSEIKSNQIAAAQCTLDANIQNEINQSFQSNIQNITKNFIDQDAKNEQGFFAIALSLQINEADTSTKIANRISNLFQDNIENQCGQEVRAYNNQKLILCGTITDSFINIGQNAIAYALSSCVIRNVVTAYSSDVVLNDLFQQTNQALLSKQEGITGLFKWLVIGGVILAVLLVIGLIIWFLLSRGKESAPVAPGINISFDPMAYAGGLSPQYYQY